MLNLKCIVKITNKDTNKIVSFDYVNNIEIKTSRSNLTDTATIKIPARIHWKNQSLEEFIGTEDKVTIEIGYEEYGLQLVFTGILTEIKKEEVLLELSCENQMYWLKQKNVEAQEIEKNELKTFFVYAFKKDDNLKNVIPEIADKLYFGGINIEKKMKMSQVLELIKEKYPYLKFYFKEGAFYAIEERIPDTDKEATVFDLSRNIISEKLKYEKASEKNCVSARALSDEYGLIFAYAPEEGWEESPSPQSNDDMPGFAKYVVFKTNSLKKGLKKGYTEESRECHECETPGDLQQYVNKIAENKNAARMTGTFTAFGIPFVRKGEIVTMKGEGKEWNNKQFIVEDVDCSFGTKGYRQTIALGREIQF